MVNHQAERPKLNASWAVPTVHCPPMRVPINAPQTIQLPDLPPVVKDLASFTFLPERKLAARMSPMVSRMPMIWRGVSIVRN